MHWFISLIVISSLHVQYVTSTVVCGEDLFKIDGQIQKMSSKDTSWMSDMKVMVAGEPYRGYIRPNGFFTIHCVPSGSYVIEIAHPVYTFKPARVDILPSGKMRAHEVIYAESKKVRVLPYPLQFKEYKKIKYFEKREKMGIKEIITNPLVIQFVSMGLPILLLFYVQQMMKTPDNVEAQQQVMHQMKNMTSGFSGTFDIAEWLTHYFHDYNKSNEKKKQVTDKDSQRPTGNSKRRKKSKELK